MEMRNVDLNLLKAFDALMDERSVTRAAARLALTQPAVSGALNRLREAFGDPLFVRSQRGVVPTDRALELSAPVKRILTEIDRLLTPAEFDPVSAEFTVSVAATDYALQAVVQPFIAALHRRAPRVRVAVHALHPDQIFTRMERGQLDMALLTPDTAPPDLHSRQLFEEDYVCAMRVQHPGVGPGPLTLDAFCAMNHGVVSMEGGRFSTATDAALARLGRQRRVTVSVPSFLMLMELLRHSDLAALLPRRLLRGVQDLWVHEPPLSVPGFTKILTWHARTHESPGHRWVRQLLAQSCSVNL